MRRGSLEEKVEENGEQITKQGADIGTYYIDRNSGELYQLDIASGDKMIIME